MQQVDLVLDDDTATTAEDLDVAGAAFCQQLDQVGEVLDVPTLIGTDRHTVRVLRDGRGNDLVHRAIVPQVHHFGPLRLQDATHDVDRRVMAVEQARRGDEPDRVLWGVQLGAHTSKILGRPTILKTLPGDERLNTAQPYTVATGCALRQRAAAPGRADTHWRMAYSTSVINVCFVDASVRASQATTGTCGSTERASRTSSRSCCNSPSNVLTPTMYGSLRSSKKSIGANESSSL